ncbi:MAG: hypothetical protein E6J72_10050 [Deltaproteobacteria bacterium]|nr:MAG: hypothetical protein E6J72_10050 [Deltaproteobacteria bacterium]
MTADGSLDAQCLCGGVRIEISGRLGPLVYCHCTRCQKASGTAFGANANVRNELAALITQR